MAQSGTVPNFFIIGAPKCGTTALSQYLSEHENIFVPGFKEPHYFADDFDQYRAIKTLEQYSKLFQPCSEKHVRVGEASVLYLYSKVAIRNIREFNPDSKIMVMVRNPVDLVYSLHSQLLYSFHETEKDFNRAWALQDLRRKGKNIPKTCRLPELLQYRDMALLGNQAERLMEIFPSEQIKFILFEEFTSNAAKVYKEVLSFLEVPPDNRLQFPVINSNKAHRSYLLARVLQKKNNKPASWLVKLDRRLSTFEFGRKLRLKDNLLNLNLDVSKRAPMESRFRHELSDVFRPDIEKLSALIARDLSHWLHYDHN